MASPPLLRAEAGPYVEARGGRWFILSALHGAISPGCVIEPYDMTIADMTAADRRIWGERVADQLAARIGPRTPVVFIAGRLYREPLSRWAGSRSTVPMQGLGIGQQKAWLADQAREARDRRAQLDLFNGIL